MTKSSDIERALRYDDGRADLKSQSTNPSSWIYVRLWGGIGRGSVINRTAEIVCSDGRHIKIAGVLARWEYSDWAGKCERCSIVIRPGQNVIAVLRRKS